MPAAPVCACACAACGGADWESVARTTRGLALSACSDSHRAQHIVRRTHSGEGEGVGVEGEEEGTGGSSAKSIWSQRTNAASCWTRTRGFVPTCDSSIREAVRARWASGVDPFLRRSSVFSAGVRARGRVVVVSSDNATYNKQRRRTDLRGGQ
jgi:hypothetical protein